MPQGLGKHQLAFQIHRSRYLLGPVDTDDPLLTELHQVLIHGLHLVFVAAVFNMFLDFIQPAVANAGLNGGGAAHHLDHGIEPLPRFVLHQAQGDDGDQDVGQALAEDILGIGGEIADQPVDGRDRPLGVEG